MDFFGWLGGKKQEPEKTQGKTMAQMGLVYEPVIPEPMTPERWHNIREQPDFVPQKTPARVIQIEVPQQAFTLTLAPIDKEHDPGRIYNKDHHEHFAMVAQVERNEQTKESPHATVQTQQNAPPIKFEITAEDREAMSRLRSEIARHDLANTREHQNSHGHGYGD